MKVVAFHGSPRKGGNTELLLHEVLKAVDTNHHSIQLFSLSKMNIRHVKTAVGVKKRGFVLFKMIWDKSMRQ
ncbi:MAG: NAD(P)H-dependent oxidoreductase [Syntrophorhabdus sp.]